METAAVEARGEEECGTLSTGASGGLLPPPLLARVPVVVLLLQLLVQLAAVRPPGPRSAEMEAGGPTSTTSSVTWMIPTPLPAPSIAPAVLRRVVQPVAVPAAACTDLLPPLGEVGPGEAPPLGGGGRASLGGRARYHQQQAEQQRPVESHQFGDDDDDAPMPFADDDDDDEAVGGGSMDVEPSPVTSGTTTAAVGEKRKVADDADGDEGDADASSPSSKKVSFEKYDNANADMEVDGEAKAATTASTTKAPRRRQFAKAKVGSKMSAPLRAAMEAKRAQQAAVARVTQASASAQVKQEGAAKFTGAANNGGMSTTAPRSLDATSASFRPDVIEGESNQSDEMKAAAAANLESVIQTETDVAEGKDANRYLDFFWTDAKEHPSRKGTILLFGKVEVNAAHNAKSKANKAAPPKQHVSCCVAVSGNSRNLFVLPRKKEGGSDGNEFESMMDVHTELKSVLQPACIPNREGASWGGKVVDRQYAFHDASVPRDATKVVYDAQYPVPAEEVCMNGGRYFQKIFGAGASNLENFIVKRKRELCIRLICFGWYDRCDYWLIKLTHVILIISSSL